MTRKVFLILLALVLALSVGLVACTQPTEEGEQEYIILGAPLPLGYLEGMCAWVNLQLAVDEINDDGGVDVDGTNYKFELVTIDTREFEAGVPVSESLAAVEELILNEDPDFIIGGPIGSEVALAAMDLAYDYEMVFLWSAGFLSLEFGPKVAGGGDKYKYCFRTQGGVEPLGIECVAILEQIATYEGLDREAYIMVEDVGDAVHAAYVIQYWLEEFGWTVAGYDEFPTGTTDFSDSLLAAQDTGAPFLIPWFYMAEGANWVNQWCDRQVPMLPVGLVAHGRDSSLVNCYPKAGITDINSEAGHYIGLYESEIDAAGPGLSWVEPVCYQAVYILKDALERAGSLAVDDVIAALEGTDMTGVYGKIAFDANHDMICAADPIEGAIANWVQWIDGGRRNVYPPAIAEDDVVVPDDPACGQKAGENTPPVIKDLFDGTEGRVRSPEDPPESGWKVKVRMVKICDEDGISCVIIDKDSSENASTPSFTPGEDSWVIFYEDRPTTVHIVVPYKDASEPIKFKVEATEYNTDYLKAKKATMWIQSE